MAEKKKGTTDSASPSDAKPEKVAKKKKPEAEEAAAPVAAAPVAPAPKPAKVSIPKLAPKNKSRLPRRQKKARQKGL